MVLLMVRGLNILTAGLPVVAQSLWERATRLLPLSVFSFFIVRFKFAAKPMAFWGMLGSLVVAAALLGFLLDRWRWARHRPVQTFAAAFLFSFVPLVALALRPAAELLQARYEASGVVISSSAITREVAEAVTVYAAVFAFVYTILVFQRRRDAAETVPMGQTGEGPTRRQILHRGVILLVGTVAGFSLARWLAAIGQAAVAFAQTVFDRVKGLPSEITPTESFYIVSKNPPGFDPVLDAFRWHLEVSGLVGKPLTLTLDQIKAMPPMRRPHTLECISNDVGGDLISNANWRGVRLREVLDRAGGVGAKTIQIAFRCADGYTESIPIAEALNPETLLVYEINGAPLPAKHGFPLRLLVPGHFGMKNPKWITKIEAIDYDLQGYWEHSGWSQKAIVKTTSKFVTPGGHMTFKVGEDVGLGGVAYSGDRGIKGVEVSTDNGATWTAAQIKPPLGPYTWVLWAAVWTPTGSGEYTVRVRATDGKGALQSREEVGTLPDGASGYHVIRVRVSK